MAGEFNSGVKFDSKAAERNVESFSRKIGQLSSAAKGAKTEAGGLGKSLSATNNSLRASAVNAEKAAKGTLSFSRSADAATRAQRGLIAALGTTGMTAAARAAGRLGAATRAASVAMREAARSSGTLAASAGRVSTSASAATKNIRLMGGAAGKAALQAKSLMGAFEGGRITQIAALFNSMYNSFRTTASRMAAMKKEAQVLVPLLGRIGTGGTAAGKGLDRIISRLNIIIPLLGRANAGARLLSKTLVAMSGSYRLNVTGAATFGRAAQAAAGATGNLNAAVSRSSAPFGAYQKRIQATTRSLTGMGVEMIRVRNLAVYMIGGLGIAKMVEYMDTINLVRARLGLLSQDYNLIGVLERRLQAIALDTRTGYRDNASLFTKLALAGKAYGVSMSTALTITDNVSKAMKISGASASESAAATQQLAQAFSSGRIQGDELRSVLENSPRLAQALATELSHLGVNLGNIRDMASEGKIGINELVKAFGSAEITKKLSEEFRRMPITMGEAFKKAETRLMVFLGALDRTIGITPSVVAALEAISTNFDTIGIAAGFAAVAITASYIPAIIRASRASAAFFGLSIARYGFGIAKSFKDAGSAIGLFGSVVAATKLGTFKNALSVTGILLRVLGVSAAAVFLRFPPLIAVAVGALALYNSKQRVTANEAGLFQDYMVTGFQLMGTKIKSVFTSVSEFMVDAIQWAMGAIMATLDGIYRSIKFVVATAKDAPGIVSRATSAELHARTGGMLGTPNADPFRAGNFAAQTGLREDFASGVKGSAWQRAANNRANERNLTTGAMGKMWDDFTLNHSEMPTGTITPETKEDKKGGKSEAEKENDRIEALRKELDSLKSSLDPVEQARQKFNEGLITLDQSLKDHLIPSTKEYQALLKQLAADTFPGIKNDIEEITKENDKLRMSLAGKSEVEISVAGKSDEIDKQLSQIDQIIAKDGDRTGILAQQKQVLRDQLGVYKGMADENSKLKKADEARLEAQRQMTSLIDDAMNKLQETFTNNIRNMLSFSKNSFKNFFGSILSMARDTFASMLSAAVFGPIQGALRGSMEKAFLGKTDYEGPSIGSILGLGSQREKSRREDRGVDLDPLIDKLRDPMEVRVINTQTALTGIAGAFAPSNDNDASGNGGEIQVTGSRKTGFFEQFTEAYKQSTAGSFRLIGDTLKPIGKAIGKGLKDMGISTGNLGKVAGKAFAGAQMGASIAGLGKMLGIKTSTTGGAIGGAIGGAVGGPVGSLIGGTIGSIVGGMFKKAKKGSVSLSTDANGRVDVGDAVGRGSTHKQNATILGNAFGDRTYQIADALGGDVARNLQLGSIGQRKKKFVYDPSGSNRTKGPGVQKFKTEEEAIAAAIADGIKKGLITGLSATSDRVLRTFKDVDRAIAVAATIEDVKRQASLIRDPIKGSYEALKKSMDKIADVFREAGASAEDYADLNVVIAEQFRATLEEQTGALKAFRESLKSGDLSYLSPTNKLKAADDKFRLIEARVASGQFVDQNEFTDAGQALQASAREVYGSTPEFAAYQNRLIDATNKVIASAESQAASYKPVVDAVVAQTQVIAAANQNIAAQTAAITAGNNLVAGEVRGIGSIMEAVRAAIVANGTGGVLSPEAAKAFFAKGKF